MIRLISRPGSFSFFFCLGASQWEVIFNYFTVHRHLYGFLLGQKTDHTNGGDHINDGGDHTNDGGQSLFFSKTDRFGLEFLTVGSDWAVFV